MNAIELVVTSVELAVGFLRRPPSRSSTESSEKKKTQREKRLSQGSQFDHSFLNSVFFFFFLGLRGFSFPPTGTFYLFFNVFLLFISATKDVVAARLLALGHRHRRVYRWVKLVDLERERSQ